MLRIAGILIVTCWVFEMFCHIRLYTDPVSVCVSDGAFGIFWKGDPAWRKQRLVNGWSWPRSDEDRGTGVPEWAIPETWDWHGPYLPLESLSDVQMAWEYGYFARTFGFRWPHIQVEEYAACVVLPLGWPAFGVLVWTTLSIIAARRRTAGRCKCGYDLRMNTSGICPECGSTRP